MSSEVKGQSASRNIQPLGASGITEVDAVSPIVVEDGGRKSSAGDATVPQVRIQIIAIGRTDPANCGGKLEADGSVELAGIIGSP